MKPCAGLLMILLLSGCATHAAPPRAKAVRQCFVPRPHVPSCGDSAICTTLQPFAREAPGVRTVMAHAGIGDSFPVRESAGPTLFEVAVVSGDDDHLLVEVRSQEGSQRLDLRRDKPVTAQVGEREYTFAYPSVFVSSAGPTTTDRPLLFVSCSP